MIQRHFVAAAPPPPRGVKYAHATEAGGWLYVTGQLPTDPAAPAAPLPEGIEAQAEQTFKNLDRDRRSGRLFASRHGLRAALPRRFRSRL